MYFLPLGRSNPVKDRADIKHITEALNSYGPNMPNRRLTIDEIKTKEYLKMTELAELNGVRYSTVKHYAELGLLPFEQQGKRLARKYKREEASTKLQEILRLREQGKSVTDIINLYIKNP